jgi:glutathione synthase/RimK-type ligase-like ATP-grasp enzyme
VDWSRYELALIRSTWNYPDHFEAFRSWADATATQTRLENSAAIVRWNSEKTYLGELAAAGVPTVPTTYLTPGGSPPLPEHAEIVVKPAVGGGARGAGRFRADQREDALAHVAALHSEGFTAMVQPYQASIDRSGERALVHFGGELSHAIVKGAVLDATTGRPGEDAHPNPQPYQPTAAERELALVTLEAAPDVPLYGRIDLVLDDAGQPIVMEAELIEPHLFLDTAPGAEDRLISALSKLLK